MNDLNNLLASATEMQRNRLYFVAFKTDTKPRNTLNTHYFTIDERLSYENFFNDFGPLTICMLYRFCQILNNKMNSKLYAGKKIVHYTSMNPEKRVNAAYLIGAYSIIYLKKTPEDAYRALVCGDIPPYIRFCDASFGLSNYTISLFNCLNAICKATVAGFIDFNDFDADEYEFYERVTNGDLNWIVPDKFLAFCGPHDKSKIKNGYQYHSPETYFNYFRTNNVTTIVRLNVKMYDAAQFVNAGFDHRDLYFVDGSTPSDHILKKFLLICEQTNGAVAVHCKAGLGRTGSLIGAYIMKHYHFSALEAIAWLRLCRPGSVIGHQQQWMEDKQSWLWAEGELYRKKNNITGLPTHKYGIYSIKQREERLNMRQTMNLPNNKSIANNNICRESESYKSKTMNSSSSSSVNDNDCSSGSATVHQITFEPKMLRDRVRKISLKVDTMKLNDEKNDMEMNTNDVDDDDNDNDDDGNDNDDSNCDSDTDEFTPFNDNDKIIELKNNTNSNSTSIIRGDYNNQYDDDDDDDHNIDDGDHICDTNGNNKIKKNPNKIQKRQTNKQSNCRPTNYYMDTLMMDTVPVTTTTTTKTLAPSITVTSSIAAATTTTTTPYSSRINYINEQNQTQGDTLNQIKAMRRRHSRSVNVSTSFDEQQLSQRHTRAKSQPVRHKMTIVNNNNHHNNCGGGGGVGGNQNGGCGGIVIRQLSLKQQICKSTKAMPSMGSTTTTTSDTSAAAAAAATTTTTTIASNRFNRMALNTKR